MHVSAATAWELTIKTVLGKLSVPAGLAASLAAQGLELLSITAEHATSSSTLHGKSAHSAVISGPA